NIGLDAGLGTGATVAVRKMSNGANTINYSLYSDSGRTTVWGNTIGTNTVAATGNGASQSYTVYGRVPAQTTPAAAAYTYTITVTVTYCTRSAKGGVSQSARRPPGVGQTVTSCAAAASCRQRHLRWPC